MKTVDPTIFKAYDIRGVYPDQLDETTARQVGRAFVAYLDARRIAVSRDMRVSSPALTDAFIDGALAQGADVVDFGMLGTDILYYAVARDNFDGGAQITASHNPKQYNGMKLVRRQALPLSGDAGIANIRDLIAEHRIPSTATHGRRTEAVILDDLHRSRAVVHRPNADPSVSSRARRRQWDGRARRTKVVRPSSVSYGRGCALISTARFKIIRRTRCLQRIGATSSTACELTGPMPGWPGTAMPTAASSSMEKASSSPGTSSLPSWRRRSYAKSRARRSCTTYGQATPSRTS